MSRPRPKRSPWQLVFRTELLGLIRDRRAMFAGLVLPALLYPLMFLGQGWLEKVAKDTLESQEVHITLDLDSAPLPMRERLLELLAQQIPIQLEQLPPGSALEIDDLIQEGTDASWQAEQELAIEALGPEGDLFLYAVPDPTTPGSTLFRLHFDGAQESSREARKRCRAALDILSQEFRDQLLTEHFGEDPGAAYAVRELDLATDEDLSGALLGRLLPLIAVLVLLSGGSYAALAAFAGEREAGTLETLLVQPVHSGAIVRGKFIAVLATSLVTLALNTGSLLLCVSLGLGSLPGGAEAAGSVPPELMRVVLAGLMLVPVCLLLVSVLCLVCGKARSFREGQHYILPLSLVSLLPAAVAMQPEVQLDNFMACVPIAGPALAFREAMVGNLTLMPGLLAIFSTLLYSAFALRKVGSLLDAEKVLGSESSAEESRQRRVQSQSALAWGWAGVLAVYLFGGLLQSMSIIGGLLATLWLLMPALTWASVRHTARRAKESIPKALGFRLPAAHHTFGAVLAGISLSHFAGIWIEWQQTVMPLPSSMTSGAGLSPEFAELSGLAMFLLMAASPGICEELFFRGAILSGLKRDLKPWKVVLWQALLFGAVHVSIYRFVPTAMIGGLAAAIALRSRSIFPAMVMHVTYNGVLVAGHEQLPWLDSAWIPWLVVPAVLLLSVPRRRGDA